MSTKRMRLKTSSFHKTFSTNKGSNDEALLIDNILFVSYFVVNKLPSTPFVFFVFVEGGTFIGFLCSDHFSAYSDIQLQVFEDLLTDFVGKIYIRQVSWAT